LWKIDFAPTFFFKLIITGNDTMNKSMFSKYNLFLLLNNFFRVNLQKILYVKVYKYFYDSLLTICNVNQQGIRTAASNAIQFYYHRYKLLHIVLFFFGGDGV
jgi:hypothetical protein